MTVPPIGNSSFGTIAQLNTSLLTIFKNGVTAQAGLAVAGFQSQFGIQSVISSAAGSLELAAAGINPASAAVFKERTLVSEAPQLVTGTASAGAQPQTFRLFVSQIARAQVSSSASVSSTAPTTIAAGTNIFKIVQGGSTTFISVNIAPGSTNNAALTAVAAAINNSAAGKRVTAEVVSTGGGNIKLNITAKATGTNAAFTVTDVTGNVVASQAIAVSTPAQNAIFQINGGPAQTSQSNSVSILNGDATLQFIAATPSTISVSIKPNIQGITDAVKDFARTFNRTISTLAATGAATGSQKNLLTGIVNRSATALKAVGIDVNIITGNISVNETAFKNALESNFAKVTDALSTVAAPVESAARAIRLQAPLLSTIAVQTSSQSLLLGSLLNTLV